MSAPAQAEYHQLAFDKLAAIFGPFKAHELMSELCAELHIELRNAQDLYLFAQHLTRRKGFEGAVGAMLGVTAITRGAQNQVVTEA